MHGSALEQRAIHGQRARASAQVRSPERLLDEVALFMHEVEGELPPERQRALQHVRERDAAFDGKTVLIAEDDVRNVFALTALLEPRRVELRTARSGRKALDSNAADPAADIVKPLLPTDHVFGGDFGLGARLGARESLSLRQASMYRELDGPSRWFQRC